MQETILLLRKQIDRLSVKKSVISQEMIDDEGIPLEACSEEQLGKKNEGKSDIGSCEEIYVDEQTPTSVISLNRAFSQDDSRNCNNEALLNSQVLVQVFHVIFCLSSYSR